MLQEIFEAVLVRWLLNINTVSLLSVLAVLSGLCSNDCPRKITVSITVSLQYYLGLNKLGSNYADNCSHT